jgi:hypothetical protein
MDLILSQSKRARSLPQLACQLLNVATVNNEALRKFDISISWALFRRETSTTCDCEISSIDKFSPLHRKPGLTGNGRDNRVGMRTLESTFVISAGRKQMASPVWRKRTPPDD